MPDQWGRPTFNDGAALAQGLRSINQDMSKQRIAEIARNIANDPNWTPGEGSRYTADEFWQGTVNGEAMAANKLRLSEGRIKEKMAQYELDRQEFEKQITPLLADDSPEGRIKIYQAVNDYSKSGITINPVDDNNVEITYPDGEKVVRPAPTHEQTLGMVQAFLDPKGNTSHRLTIDTFVLQKNIEQLLKAQDLRNPKTGELLGIKFANVIDPNTMKVGPVYKDTATGKDLSVEQIKDLHKKGYITHDAMIEGVKYKTEQLKLLNEIEKSKHGDIKVSDIDSVEKLVHDLNNKPNANLFAAAKKAANRIDMDVVEKEKTGFFGGKSKTYELIDKQTGQPTTTEGQGLASAESKPAPKPEGQMGKKTRQAKLPDGTIAEVSLNEKTGKWEVVSGSKAQKPITSQSAPKAPGGMTAEDYEKEVSQVAGWIMQNPGTAEDQKERLVREYGKDAASQIMIDVEAVIKQYQQNPLPGMIESGAGAVGAGLQSAAGWLDRRAAPTPGTY